MSQQQCGKQDGSITLSLGGMKLQWAGYLTQWLQMLNVNYSSKDTEDISIERLKYSYKHVNLDKMPALSGKDP